MTSHQEVAYTHILNRDLMAVCQHDHCAGDAAPSSVKLWPPEPFRLGCRDALDEAPIDQVYLMEAGVVLLDQN